MKEKKTKRIENAYHFTNLKFFDLTMSLANDMLKKISNHNIVDHSDIGRDFGSMKMTMYKNFSIKSKIEKNRNLKKN